MRFVQLHRRSIWESLGLAFIDFNSKLTFEIFLIRSATLSIQRDDTQQCKNEITTDRHFTCTHEMR